MYSQLLIQQKMEPQQKKLKLSETLTQTFKNLSLELVIFGIFIKRSDQILNYLSYRDLLNLSEVSKLFYQSTAVSSTFMNKIQLFIHETKSKRFNSSQFKDSSREYTVLRVRSLEGDQSKKEVAQFIVHNRSLQIIETKYDFKLPSGLQLPNLHTLMFFVMNRSKIYDF